MVGASPPSTRRCPVRRSAPPGRVESPHSVAVIKRASLCSLSPGGCHARGLRQHRTEQRRTRFHACGDGATQRGRGRADAARSASWKCDPSHAAGEDSGCSRRTARRRRRPKDSPSHAGARAATPGRSGSATSRRTARRRSSAAAGSQRAPLAASRTVRCGRCPDARDRLRVLGLVVCLLAETDREGAHRARLCACISATTVDESTPPDRNAPSGTSATICPRTLRSTRSSSSTASLSLPRNGIELAALIASLTDQ